MVQDSVSVTDKDQYCPSLDSQVQNKCITFFSRTRPSLMTHTHFSITKVHLKTRYSMLFYHKIQYGFRKKNVDTFQIFSKTSKLFIFIPCVEFKNWTLGIYSKFVLFVNILSSFSLTLWTVAHNSFFVAYKQMCRWASNFLGNMQKFLEICDWKNTVTQKTSFQNSKGLYLKDSFVVHSFQTKSFTGEVWFTAC